MGFLESVQSAYRNYFAFSGRASRPAFWWFFLFFWSVASAAFFVHPGLLLGFMAASAFPYLALAWRRLHDVGRPGYHVIAPSLSGVAATALSGIIDRSPAEGPPETELALRAAHLVFLLIALLQILRLLVSFASRSQPHVNRYGPQPVATRASQSASTKSADRANGPWGGRPAAASPQDAPNRSPTDRATPLRKRGSDTPAVRRRRS